MTAQELQDFKCNFYAARTQLEHENFSKVRMRARNMLNIVKSSKFKNKSDKVLGRLVVPYLLSCLRREKYLAVNQLIHKELTAAVENYGKYTGTEDIGSIAMLYEVSK